MKKKLVMTMIVLTLVFTGCKDNTIPDYTSAQTYLDMYVNKINKLDSKYIPALNEEIKTLGVEEQAATLKTNILDSYDIILSKAPQEDLEAFYNKEAEFVKGAKEIRELGIDNTTEAIKGNIEKFQAVPSDIQQVLDEALKSALDAINEFYTGFNKELENITYEQYQAAYGLAGVIEKYIEDSDLTDKITEKAQSIKNEAINQIDYIKELQK